MRIYPTIVLEGTLLAEQYLSGTYLPQLLEEAVSLCASLLLRCEEAGVPVIRLGLHAGGCGTEVKISVYQVVDRGEGKPSFFRKSSVIGNDGEKDGHSICIFLQAGRRMG